jgi:hypothetical protein
MKTKMWVIHCCVCGLEATYPDCMSTKKPESEWWWQGAEGFYCPSEKCQQVAMNGGRR